MNPHPFDFDTDEKLVERHRAAMNKVALYNSDPNIWEEAAKGYRARADGGPTIRALEGNVWGVPRLGWVARFESTEEAERVQTAAFAISR